jgi:alpha-D-ribose 1-methylphosphonate 5-triphosphate synthase subunit PhnH
MMQTVAQATAYAEVALASQASFRAVMDAMARPGTVHRLAADAAPSPLMPAAAALIRSLADYETPLWCDAAVGSEARDWIRFHTGAPITQQPKDASFALIADVQAMPPLVDFALGNEEYPDRSTTLIVQIARIAGPQFVLEGPGINGKRAFAATLPDNFAAQLADNRALFPCGIDIVLVAGSEIAALPRTTRLAPAGG